MKRKEKTGENRKERKEARRRMRFKPTNGGRVTIMMCLWGTEAKL